MNKSKVFKSLVLVLLFALLFVLSSCDKTYQLTIVLDDDVYRTIEVKEGSKLSDYNLGIDYVLVDLDGWYVNGVKYDENLPFKSDLTIEGITSDKEYRITFLSEGRTLRSSVYMGYDEIIVPSNPTKPSDDDYDYTFAGWDKEFDLAVSDMEINAVFTKSDRVFTVSIYDNDSKLLKDEKGTKGTIIDFPVISKATDTMYTYEFKGWYNLDGEAFDNEAGIKKDEKLFPKYNQLPVKGEDDLKGMKVSILGDSISTFYDESSKYNSYYGGHNEFFYPYYSRNWGSNSITKAEQTWWMQLINKLGANLGINNSLSGSSCYNWDNPNTSAAGCNDARINTLGENGDPDIIITWLGCNDLVNGFTEAQFRRAYNTMLTKIKAKYKNAYVFCCVMGYSAYSGYNYTDAGRLAYNNIIRELAVYHQACIINLDKVQTEATYSSMLGDRLHLNYTGATKIANQCYEDILAYFKKEN